MTTSPYVGPRSFETGEALYGRDRELRTLSALLIAERIVLMHSPSGAGKTSLLRAGLIPRLADENFKVLPIIRVNIDPPADLTTNRYIVSTLISLEEGFPAEERLPLTELACLSLEDYLHRRAFEQDIVFVFDQFEEILTISAADREGKLVFFNQLGTALRNKTRWALFSMREDYLGAMALYARPIPNRLATRFRLDLLGVDAAIQAIQEPAKSTGVNFTTPAARKLVDDLRRVQVQLPDGSMETQLGLYVEPVQLQVVCFRLWENKDPEDQEIDENDLAGVGDVNQSLAEYYALSVSKVADAVGTPERSIREWFERKLITAEGIRGQVRRGAEKSDGLPNAAVRKLEDAHIIRAEQRAGQTWYELSHDRLIEPVREDNRKWFSVHLSLFQQQAVLWAQQGKSDGLLLGGKELDKAEGEAIALGLKLTPDEQDFLDACLRLRALEKRDRRQRQFIIAGLVASLVLLVVAIVFAVRASSATLDAQEKAAAALTAQAQANQAESIAVTNEADAERQKANAEAASRQAVSGQLALASKSVVAQYPQRAQLLALEALKLNLDAGEPVTSIAEESLRAANAQVNGRGLPGFSREVSFLEFTRDNQWLLAGSVYSGEFHGWKISEIDQAGYLFFEATVPTTVLDEFLPITPYFSEQQNWFVIDLGNETRIWPMSTLQAGAEPIVFEGSISFLKDDFSLLESMGDQTILWRFDPQKLPDKTSFVLDGVYTGMQADLTTVITSTGEEEYLAWDTTTTPPKSTRLSSLPELAGEETLPEEFTEDVDLQLTDEWESISRKGFEDEPVIGATSTNRQWHAEGAFGGSLRLWNLVEEQKYQLEGVTPTDLEFTTDGQWMVWGENLWQLKDGLPAGLPIRYAENAFDAVFSLDSRWMLVVEDGEVSLLNLSDVSGNGENARLTIDSSFVYYLFFSPDSKWLVGSGNEYTGLWDLSNPQTSPSVVLPEPGLSDIAFFPGDNYVVGLKTSDGPVDYFPAAPPAGSQIWIWDVSPQTYRVTEMGTQQFDVPSQVSENGTWLIAENGQPNFNLGWQTTRTSELWDVRCIVESTSCKPFLMELPSGGDPFGEGTRFAFSQDSRYLTAQIFNGPSFAYHIWDLQAADGARQAAPRLVFDTTAKYVTAMPIWSSTQEMTRRIYLMGGGGGGGGGEPGSYKVDYGIELFNPAVGESSLQSLILRGHEEPVAYQLTSPSGRWTVTISTDSIKLWDLTVLQKDSFASPVNLPLEYLPYDFAFTIQDRVGFTVDERWLVFQRDERLEFVPLHLEDLMAYACKSVGRNFIINEWQRYFAGEPYRKTCENLPEHQSVEIELRPTPTPMPAATAATEDGLTPTPEREFAPTQPPGSSQITYTVKTGDTLSSIATLLRTDVETLIEENKIDDPDLIQVGQVLIHNTIPTPTATP